MTIGRLAKLAGLGVETIRYYHRIGLLPEPVKPKQGYRIYPDLALKQLQFITRAKQLGFSLKEITELLMLDDADCAAVQDIATQKLTMIKKKQADLAAMADTLEELLKFCRGSKDGQHCPILDTLTE